MKIETVSIIGVGYVGLTLAAVLAERGFMVYGIDIDEKLIEQLRKCEPHFHEKGLKLILRKTVGKNLFFQKEIPKEQDVFVICTGTPLDSERKPTLNYLKNSAEQTVSAIRDGSLIILRSTVPIGTTRSLIKPILDRSGKKYLLAFCPERTVEGRAIEELKELPQIIGGIDEESVDMAFDLFKRVTNTTIKMSSLEAAEMVKLLCNSYRDMTFAYANEVAFISEKLNLDPFELIGAANIGYERSKIPMPGFVGGSCLEKDPYILAECINKTGYKAKMMATSREINESIVPYVISKIKNKVEKYGKIFVSGIAFKGKPETDDIRGSVALKIIDELIKEGYTNIYVHDFVVSKEKIMNMNFVNLDEGFKDADCVLIGTNNDKYSYLEIDNYLNLMKPNSLFFDVWNIYPQKQIKENGRIYAGIGK